MATNVRLTSDLRRLPQDGTAVHKPYAMLRKVGDEMKRDGAHRIDSVAEETDAIIDSTDRFPAILRDL